MTNRVRLQQNLSTKVVKYSIFVVLNLSLFFFHSIPAVTFSVVSMLTHLISCLARAVVLCTTDDQNWVYVCKYQDKAILTRIIQVSSDVDNYFWLRASVFADKSTGSIHLNSCSSMAQQVNTLIMF